MQIKDIAAKAIKPGSPAGRRDSLDGEKIQLLNWNIQKLKSDDWREDLLRLGAGVDLILIQEAALEHSLLQSFDHVRCRTFAEGYTHRGVKTGVMTFCRVEAHSHHQFCTLEPLLRTPKATNLTQYAINDHHENLLVINLHAVNFSIGVYAYEMQLKNVAATIEAHRGPLIFAGDFNTWHVGRERIVRNMAMVLGLDEVRYEVDERKRVFGKHLDYIFTRGLTIREAVTHKVNSSDHNPMLASFSL